MTSQKLGPVEIDCYAVRRELVNYMEADLTPELRTRVDYHLQNCDHCTAVYDGVRNVVQLLGNENAIDLPRGFSQRLYRRFLSAKQ
jgi:predicted anti-sigma-YlaC factor YlaD